MSALRTFAKIHIKVYTPSSEEAKTMLAQQVAVVHADAVIKNLHESAIPTVQKLDIVDCLITASEN